MIRDCYNRFFYYFNENKKTFIKYSLYSFLIGVLELFGVALTYPFVLKLLNNEQSKSLFSSPLFIGITIVILFLVKNILMIFYMYWQAKFIKDVEAGVNLKFIKYFLISSYQETSRISFAQKGNILGFLIPNTINNFLLRLLNLNVNLFIFCIISMFLVIKFPIATIVTVVFALILIIIENSFFKPKLKMIAQKASDASRVYNQCSNEVLINLKSVKVSQNEKFFFEKYRQAQKDFYRICVKTSFFNSVPPYITEPFVIILLFILLAIISIQSCAEPEKLLASFAVIVSAIFRLAPTISRIQVNINGIHSAMPIVTEFLDVCKKINIKSVNEIKKRKFADFKSSIELKNICFGYESDKTILKNINLKINKGEFIGIAGLSGTGKTTLVDIIAGLLMPEKGEILIDGKKEILPLKIGYIPQEIVLLNSTIKDNVTFGSENIDDERIIDVLRKAQLYDFVIDNYKDGIYANPFVDSTGFSQGQKQRLAIARALYSEPDVLILDEATSSLDLKTENEICAVLKELRENITIIAIAHRLSTIKSADKIVFMKDSQIAAISEFQELINMNDDFKELVKLAYINEP